jgi:hypothetical protein
MGMSYGIDITTLNALAQEGRGMPDAWQVASDVGRRLADLREHLGENQRDFAARFGRG